MTNYSFYGGQQGRSFEISETFTSKVEMMQDLIKRYASSIGIGEMVFISYGLPNDETSNDYTNRAQLDSTVFGRTYNGTLWQKIYLEEGDLKGEDIETAVTWKEIAAYPYIEKIFVSSDYGLGYKLIAAVTGNTPRISVTYEDIPASSKPSVSINNSNSDFPIIHFRIPREQLIRIDNPASVLHVFDDPQVSLAGEDTDYPTFHFSLPQAQQLINDNVTFKVLNADEKPTFDYDASETKSNADGTLKADRPTMALGLPQSQILQYNETDDYKVLNADESPVFELDNSDINNPRVKIELPQSQRIITSKVTFIAAEAGTPPSLVFNTIGTADDGIERINEPELTFTIPKGQVISEVNVVPVDADEEPSADWDDSNPTSPILTFNLPQSQIFDILSSVVLGPTENPSVTYDDTTDINSPKITFNLPRAVKFIYGDLLGEQSQGSYTIAANGEIADLEIGDYYVNKATGFTYVVTAKTDSDLTFQFVVCLRSPLPSMTAESIDSYNKVNDVYETKEPVILSSYANPTEMTGWTIKLGLPQIPDFVPEVEFLGVDEEGSISGAPSNVSEYTYKFKIPRGAKLFGGNLVNDTYLTVNVDGAKLGDIYLNGDSTSPSCGNYYKLGEDGWVKQGNIRGEVGAPLNVVNSFTITLGMAAKPNDTLAEVSAWLESQLSELPLSNELIAVNYENAADDQTSYWYFYANDAWGRVQLTGGFANILQNNYDSTNDENKTYSSGYINGLIASEVQEQDKQIKTYNAKTIEDLISALPTWGSFDADGIHFD